MTNTFAYTLVASEWNESLKNDLEEYYWGGVIEAFIDGEDQYIEFEQSWPFNWAPIMRKIAVVQLCENFDPRPYLLSYFAFSNITPNFQQSATGENNIFYFSEFPDCAVNDFSFKNAKRDDNFNRFIKVLSLTLQLCKERNSGLLFIGGWGFSTEDELDLEAQRMIASHGIKITGRTTD